LKNSPILQFNYVNNIIQNIVDNHDEQYITVALPLIRPQAGCFGKRKFCRGPPRHILNNFSQPEKCRQHLSSIIMNLKKNTADIIFERIRERIISGDYSPSQHLVEVKIADEMGVSRHIIRIALGRLQSEGLIRIEPNRGAVVAALTLDEVIDIITARQSLECAAARLAANQIKPLHIRSLEECLHTMYRSIASSEYDAYSKTNREFHRIICDAAKSSTITELIDLLRARLARLPMRTLLLPGRCDQSMAEHEAILNSLKSGNADEAEANAKRHMINLKSAIEGSWDLIRS